MNLQTYKWRAMLRWLCWWGVCVLLAGCVSSNSDQPANDSASPTATPLTLLEDVPVPTPNTTTTPTDREPLVLLPIIAAPTTATDGPSAATNYNHRVFLPAIYGSTDQLGAVAVPSQDEQIGDIVIYDDTLDPNWTVEHSQQMRSDLAATDYVLNGMTAIAVTPTADFGRFFLAVRPDTDIAYSRDRILGVSFWLNGGENPIATDDLAVTVMGSNAHTYWVAGDKSAQMDAGIPDSEVTEDAPLFSETRLYYLDINRTIPPDTWVEVIVWLDNLSYDPFYDYITGIYIKNDEGFLNTFYIDRVSLLVERR